MGYISKDIAVITEPDIVTLSAVPNFVQFASKPADKMYLEVNIQVNVTPSTSGVIPSLTLIQITDASGFPHTYRGTTNTEGVGGSTFYVSNETSDTAENLRQVLLADKWFSANFEAVIPFLWQDGNLRNGAVLNIKSKGAGTDFNIGIEAPNNAGNAAYTFTWINRISRNNDSISGEASTAEVDLDIYVVPDVFLGQDDKPITPARLGKYVTTLQKTYAGVPVWFELNTLFSQYGGYNLPPGTSGWFDTGTSRVYRFTAKVKALNSFYFYQSNALYVLHGHGLASEGPDLSRYVYNGNTIKLLTDKPRTPYIRGQKEYLNFIFSDPQRGVSQPIDFTLRIAYRVYSTSDMYLGTVYGQEKARADFWVVNTCQLDIDAVLDQYPTAGIIRVALARGTALVSNDLEYTIRPECLHMLRQFSFINRLGGWDAFNFDAGIKDEIKPSVDTYNKTITPLYQKGDSIETVYNTTLANTITVEGAPVTDDVAIWLKQLAAARVILDSDGNYIIIEDFTLQVTAANKNMHKPTIKYRLSE